MYENGTGGKKDINKAIELYRKAGNLGIGEARDSLARLEASQTAKPQQKPSANVAKNTKNPPQQPKTQPKPVQQAAPAPSVTPAPAQNNNVPVFANNTSGTKPRLAVLAFEDKSEERKANPDTIRTSMVTALHKTEIFNLQERERLDDLKDELTLGQSGLMDASTAAKIGKLRGAQYVMMGAITLCYYSEKASGFIFPVLGFETRAKTAYVVIDIRIVDVETGDILYTESKTGEASNKTKKNIAQSEKMIGGLLDMATRNAVDKHVSAIRVLGFHS
jgi:curli biogenesis system outer membrane secretion channel CsgG